MLVLLIVGGAIAALDRLLMPSARWFLRRRINRAINEVNKHLKISLRPFQLTKRQVLIDRLSYDTEVIAAMEAHAKQEEMPREVAQAKVVEYAREIVPAFNAYIYFRIGYWLSKRLARFVYRVHFGVLDPKLLEKVQPDDTVVFVMNHRSNMDYILVSYLVSRQSTLSYAVGEWARIWPLDILVKAMGAFFVRRNSGDALYRKVLERYVSMATEEGVCQAVFPEGGLSHDGLMRKPRLGFLDYILRSFDAETSRNIVFIPIGINYDRVIEDRSLLRRRDPGAAKRSKWFVFRTTAIFLFKNLAMGRDERRKRFGYAGLNFGEPISARTHCTEHGVNFARLERDERFQAVEQLAERLMGEVARVTPVLPVPLTASVFLREPETAFDSFAIKLRVHDLFHELQSYGAPVREKEMPLEGTIMRAVEMLQHRGLILEENGSYRANPEAQALLEFYANSLAHWESSGQPV